MKKYELTNETKEVNGRTLYRIKALIDLYMVSAGNLGGWIEKEENLSQKGGCWVYPTACVYDNAVIEDDAYISGNARVFDRAHVYGNAHVYDSAWVYGDAHVCGNAQVFGETRVFCNAHVYGDACVFGRAKIFDCAYVFNKACIYGNAWVHDYANVYDNAHVYDNASVCGNAKVCGNAQVCEHMRVSYSYTKTDLREDIAASLRCQCNLPLINNKVIAYKIVNKNLSSLYDENFIYEVGKIAEVKDAEENNESCANGLHFSNLTYWDSCVKEYTNKTYLVAEIDVEDIITIQKGKIRCRKAKILDKIDII